MADENVYVIGGANSAGQAALYLSRFAKRVTILVRAASLSEMSEYLVRGRCGNRRHPGAGVRSGGACVLARRRYLHHRQDNGRSSDQRREHELVPTV